jgi:5'-nucleotidase (lipoprotein e(P4) family)
MRERSCFNTLGYIWLTIGLVLSGCSALKSGDTSKQDSRQSHALLNSVLWVQTSPEYEFVCREVFRLAEIRLDEAIPDGGWTAALEQTEAYEDLPPAVILDVDETVLDNSPFEARLITEGREYNKPMWDEWVVEAGAQEIPGAAEFVQHALGEGVEVFFVTNRSYANEEHTLRNLRDRFGPIVTAENVLSKDERADWAADKTSRRAYVARTHRVLLLIGDDFNDFAYLGTAGPEERTGAARKYQDRWGSKWILLPNPMYGHWEQALYGYDRDLDDAVKLDLKYRALDTSR